MQYTLGMADKTRAVHPGPRAGTVRCAEGQVLPIPAGWVHLPPGDPALTGRVKKLGPVWTMHEKVGRKLFSRGLYAPEERIAKVRSDLAAERADPAYAKKLESARKKRGVLQQEYEQDFHAAVVAFLAFAPLHTELADALARAITEHATPVGSGTVARTQRIPLAQRAEAATIAWLRHATTGYDDMSIPRVRGMRQEVRRALAERSRRLLERYRRGETIAAQACLLRRGLARTPRPGSEGPRARG